MGAPLDLTPMLPGLERVAGRLLEGVEVPRVTWVRQRLDPPVLEDIEAHVRSEVGAALERTGRAPQRVAVGAGSRGVANYGRIVTTVVETLREAGWDPFVVPAMGSHGAASAEGQTQVLADHGIDRELVRATMETEVVGVALGVPVHVDRNVAEAGAVFLVNRIKPHTSFRGAVESGLAKMAAVGLGKQPGARTMHAEGVNGLRDRIPVAARLLRERGLLVGGLGIIENQRDETARVAGLAADEVGEAAEAALLEEARRLMPAIPFGDLDVLVIERMGKDISGAGMDTNVLGRMRVIGQPEPQPYSVTAVVVLDLTDASHGNAMGIGSADYTTARLVSKIDFEALYTNGITAGLIGIERMKLPVIMPNDLSAVLAAIAARGRSTPIRLALIRDTLHVAELRVSEALVEEARGRDDLEVVGGREPMPFDASGRLRPLG